MKNLKSFAAASSLMLAAASTISYAQQSQPAPSDEPLEIVVKGIRDPTLIHYGQMRWALGKFSASSQSPRVHMVLRLIAKNSAVDIDRVKVNLRSDDGNSQELKTLPGGRVYVPLDTSAVGSNPDFVIFAKKGSVSTQINVIVETGSAPISYRQLMDDMKIANDAERALMTPTQSMRFSNANALVLEFARGSQGQVTIASPSEGTITLVANQKGHVQIPYDPKVYSENPNVEVRGSASYGMVTTERNPKWKSN